MFTKCILLIVGIILYNSNSVSGQNCGDTIFAKTHTITNPTNPSGSCVYNIRPHSFYVCQVRIDFEIFTLPPPTTAFLNYPHCTDDSFEFYVGNTRMSLCGENSGQHIYIPQNSTNGIQPITITFRITSSGTAQWKLLISQLDCPVGSPLRDSFPMENNLIEPETKTFYDGFKIAPVGCLQYYPEPSGNIKSFNFNAGIGPYIGNMDYAICFRRTSATSRVRFTAPAFQMAGATAGFDASCYSVAGTANLSEDHLFLPDAEVVFPGGRVVRATRYCSNIFATATSIEISPPGPFVIQFHSDILYDAAVPETGFSLNYQLVN